MTSDNASTPRAETAWDRRPLVTAHAARIGKTTPPWSTNSTARAARLDDRYDHPHGAVLRKPSPQSALEGVWAPADALAHEFGLMCGRT